MWSEEMDKNLRAASEKSVPTFEEKNWKDMEVLLEKHLPQQKRRRRIIFLILLPLLAVSGILLTRQQITQKQTASSQTDVPVSVVDELKNNPSTKEVPAVTSQNTIEKTVSSLPGAPVAGSKTNYSTATEQLRLDNKNDKNIIAKQSPKAGILSRKRQAGSIESKQQSPDISLFPAITQSSSEKNNISKSNSPNLTPEPGIVAADQQAGNKIPTESTSVTSPSISAEKKETVDSQAVAVNDPVKSEKGKKSKSSRFSIYLSAGPDYSSVRFSEPGEVRLQYGIGIGYAISDRFTVRTGVYAGHKIYSADSSDYKAASYGNYKLYEVNADCLVYEIPVSVLYNFKQSGKHNFFASAGLSSYIMKKEDYTYSYKNTWGQTLLHDYSYRNENKHLFSVLSISGGYQYHFNKRFSLLAEPYLKMPFTGVGQGKVKLNNTGVLFTLSMKPFAR